MQWVWLLAVQRQKSDIAIFQGTLNKGHITASILSIPCRSVYYFLKQPFHVDLLQRGRPRIEFDDFDENGLCRLILGFNITSPAELPTAAAASTKSVPYTQLKSWADTHALKKFADSINNAVFEYENWELIV